MAKKEEIQNNIEKKSNIRKITSIGILISCATALQLLESPLPRLFPWLKIGLANILTLYAIVRINKTTGIAVAALRTCLAALVFCGFLSPIHIISFSGAVTAAIVMGFIHQFFPKTSICIISIFGAISSNVSQLMAVQFIFSSNLTLWFHLSMIIWTGIPAGFIVGKITYELLRRT